MAEAVLRCKVSFTVNDKTYNGGDIIPLEDHIAWPPESLPNRLMNGFVAWAPIDAPVDTPAKEKKPRTGPAPMPVDATE